VLLTGASSNEGPEFNDSSLKRGGIDVDITHMWCCDLTAVYATIPNKQPIQTFCESLFSDSSRHKLLSFEHTPFSRIVRIQMNSKYRRVLSPDPVYEIVKLTFVR